MRDLLEPDIWDGYFKFCNLRNPWDKTVSWFHFMNPGMKQKPQGEIFATFRAWLQDTNDVGMDKGIYLIIILIW